MTYAPLRAFKFWSELEYVCHAIKSYNTSLESSSALMCFNVLFSNVRTEDGLARRDEGGTFASVGYGLMDAVQRMRQKARDFGYLQSNEQVRVTTGPYIEIYPVNPTFIIVPYYNPL